MYKQGTTSKLGDDAYYTIQKIVALGLPHWWYLVWNHPSSANNFEQLPMDIPNIRYSIVPTFWALNYLSTTHR